MKGTLVIARRELLEKRFVFLAAAAFAMLSVAIPLMPIIRGTSRREALVALSSGFAIIFAIAVAAILGATIVGRELSERRLSFYFSKPVPAASIWFGKLIAAFLLVLLSGAIIAAPALFAGIQAILSLWTISSNDIGVAAVVTASILAATFLLSHVISTFVRSRSAWIILDFIAATVCAVVLGFLAQRLVEGFAFELVHSLLIVFGVFAAAAIVAGGAWQLASGRTDRKRSHRELSRFLWMSIGGGLLTVAAYVAWIVSVKPGDLRRDGFLVQAKNGSWAVISGHGNHRGDYRASFLYNLIDGRSIRISQMYPSWTGPFPNPNVVFWLVPSSNADELWLAKLDIPNPKPAKTRITMRQPAFVNSSDDGSRLMLIGRGGLLTVFDVARGASLGSARIPVGDRWAFGVFVGPDVVRVYGRAGQLQPMPIWEYDSKRRVVTATGELPLPTFHFSSDRRRALLSGQNELEIRDARTGALLHSVSGKLDSARFLRDGRIVAIDRDRSLLRVFSADGAPLRDIQLPSGQADLLVDSGNGRVVVVIHDQRCVVADIDRGVIVRVEPGLRPLSLGNAGPRLICDSGAGIVVWNPATGEKRLLARS